MAEWRPRLPWLDPSVTAMLSLPLHRHRLRRTAWVTLLAWVLASLAGMVNACQLQPHDARVPLSITGQPLDSAGPVVHAEAAQHGADHMDRAACLAHLADAASTVAKGESAQAVVAGAVMPLGLEWRLTLPKATVPLWRSSARPGLPGVALVIRLLRLTI